MGAQLSVDIGAEGLHLLGGCLLAGRPLPADFLLEALCPSIRKLEPAIPHVPDTLHEASGTPTNL